MTNRSLFQFLFNRQYFIGIFSGFFVAAALIYFPVLNCDHDDCSINGLPVKNMRIRRMADNEHSVDGSVKSPPNLVTTTGGPVPSTATELKARKGDRILCWVVTTPFSRAKAEMVKKTWGPRCDKLLFMSSQNESTLPAIGLPLPGPESRTQLWNKAKLTFRYIYDHHLNDYDWFFKADEDTYAIIENMRYFLSTQDPSQPLFLGRRFKGFLSGGPGYILTREAIRRLVEVGINKDACKTHLKGYVDDVIIARCLTKLNVTFGDTRDEQGLQTFIPYRIEEFFSDEGPNMRFIRGADYYPYKKGYSCCSSRAISFHYVSGTKMQLYEYLVYKMKVVNNTAAN